MCTTPVWAALGDTEDSIAHDVRRHQARSQRQDLGGYTVHRMNMADGSQIRQYVAPDRRIFAVSWNARHKPDLSLLLGAAYTRFANAAQQAGAHTGALRSLHHTSLDLVVQSAGHLQVYTGYAYHPSMVPAGFDMARLGRE